MADLTPRSRDDVTLSVGRAEVRGVGATVVGTLVGDTAPGSTPATPFSSALSLVDTAGGWLVDDIAARS